MRWVRYYGVRLNGPRPSTSNEGLGPPSCSPIRLQPSHARCRHASRRRPSLRVGVMTDRETDEQELATIDEALATHVVYEYRMMLHAVVVIQREAQGTMVHILALEAFGIHYRILLHFFKPRRIDPSDVLARRYIGEDVAVPDEHRKDLNRWLAHLSTERLKVFEGDRKIWPTGEMVKQLEVSWQEFLKRLGETHPERVDWFTNPQLRAEELPPPITLIEDHPGGPGSQ